MNKIQEISKGYGLEIRQVEPDVYQVENNTLEVNIDRLKRDIGDCSLVVTDNHKYEKDKDGYNWNLSNIYYIINGADNENSVKYLMQLLNKGKKVILSDFRVSKNSFDIGTIYSAEELGKV